MFTVDEGKLLGRQDRLILEWAETLLKPDRPDWFDFSSLAKISGVQQKTILDRFPYPELLSVGVLVLMWDDRWPSWRASQDNGLIRSNGYKLIASDWEPDPELLKYFADHPVVRSYLKGEPPIRMWFKKSGEFLSV